jgi:Protein of unknown function (DUF1071)
MNLGSQQTYLEEEQHMSTASSFTMLAAINVNSHVEKKNNLSYLSWAWAVDQLMRSDPSASWEFREWDQKPMLVMPDQTAMVHCTVTAFGTKKSVYLPVMDHKNKAIVSPDAFAINTAMQRALVKAIALHGLGLYIYAGEDLPAVEQQQASEADKALTDAAEAAARKGTAVLRAYWKALGKPEREQLEGRIEGLRGLAQTADVTGFNQEMDKADHAAV